MTNYKTGEWSDLLKKLSEVRFNEDPPNTPVESSRGFRYNNGSSWEVRIVIREMPSITVARLPFTEKQRAAKLADIVSHYFAGYRNYKQIRAPKFNFSFGHIQQWYHTEPQVIEILNRMRDHLKSHGVLGEPWQ